MIELSIDSNGIMCWYIFYKQLTINRNPTEQCGTYKFSHNNNGPAFIGTYVVEWYANGNYHRLDGPAVVWGNITRDFYINNKKYDNALEYWIAVQNYDKT